MVSRKPHPAALRERAVQMVFEVAVLGRLEGVELGVLALPVS
jgi:hypothetical protein